MNTSAFSLADDYASLAPSAGALVARESGSAYRSGFLWTERHLQCLWFDSRYRPSAFALPGGETLEVLDPGEWNLEAGPDFLNATVRIQPGARCLRGDVEVHVHPTDWDAHEHARDPAYARVVVHVTWFEAPPARSLPPGALSVSLAAPILARRSLSLDDIDLKAYPHAVLPESPRPCERLLRNRPDRVVALLRAAGQHRLRTKAARMAERLRLSGDRHQVFYEEVMAALGYKHNQGPFRSLARQLPATALGASRETAYARLLGVAHLLPQPDAACDEEGRAFIRTLWDLWWRDADALSTPEPPGPWRTSGQRPQNAPLRRLAAAASLFSGVSDILHELDRFSNEPGEAWLQRARASLEARCRWPFWNSRLSLSSHPDPARETALLGESRADAILLNVAIPFAAAEGRLPSGVLDHLPPEDLSSPMRLAANHLLGRDHNPALYSRDGLLQQGLLQIHLDFCLNARPGCEACTLCGSLARGG